MQRFNETLRINEILHNNINHFILIYKLKNNEKKWKILYLIIPSYETLE